MRALVVVLALLGLVACTDPWVGEGVVTERQYDDPDEWWSPGHVIQGTQTCSGSGSSQVCTRSADIHIPGHMVYESERWLLTVTDDEGEKHTVSVSEAIWNECTIGRKYTTTNQDCRPR